MGADDPVKECVFPFTRTDYDGVTHTHDKVGRPATYGILNTK